MLNSLNYFNLNLRNKIKKYLLVNGNSLKQHYCLKSTSSGKSKKNEDYSKTLNLPNSGKFELSMKKICENEEQIKKVQKFKQTF